ncbi:MAG: oligosaccharide flippase family protein [Bacteroidales bacterium]|nr:oligosaccharide flippase family protein [Bacteroidales bacterium]
MLKQKFLFDFGSKFLLYFITAITGIIVARVAGPKVIGTIAYGLSFVSMFGFIYGLFGTSHIKLISEGQDLGKCNRIYSTLMIISVIIFVLIVVSFFFTEKFVFKRNFTNTEQTVIFISLAFTGIQALYKIAEITFIGLTQQAKANIPAIIRAVIYNGGRITVVLLGFGAVALVSVNLITSILVIPVYLFLLKNISFKGEWDNNLFKRHLSIGFPVLIVVLTNSFILNYGKIMLKNYSSTEELGYYAGGYSIAGMLLMIGSTAGTILFPLFSNAFTNNNTEYVKKIIAKYERFLFLFIMPLILTFSVFSDPIIPFLMSNKYLPSVPIFSLLVFASFFMIWGMPYYNLIRGMNKFKILAEFNIFFFIVFFGSLYVFLNNNLLNLGALGLALGVFILNFVKFLTWFLFSKKIMQINISKKIFFFILLYIAFLGISLLLKNEFLNSFSVLLKFVIAILYITCIYCILYLTKLLKKQDVDFLLKTINIKSLFNYTKDEIKK